MGHKKDWIERFRRWIIPKLGILALIAEEVTGENYYVQYDLRNKEFVGRVSMDEEEFEKFLHEQGFSRNPLSALKRLARTSEVEEGSWRLVGFDDYPDRQLHIILYDGSAVSDADTGYTYIYAHWEYRWDTNPKKHYRGVDYDEKEGVLRMRRILESNGVQYDFVQP